MFLCYFLFFPLISRLSQASFLIWFLNGSRDVVEFFPLTFTMSWQNKKKRAQTKIQEVSSEHQETLFYCEGAWSLAQVAQVGCRCISLLGDIQKLPGCGAGQSAPGGPA